MKTEREKRDAALDKLEATRAELIEAARFVADALAKKNTRVTSPEVLKALAEHGYETELQSVDRRFMGGVFRRGWKRVGWQATGSHCRPVSIWEKLES